MTLKGNKRKERKRKKKSRELRGTYYVYSKKKFNLSDASKEKKK